MDRQSLTSRPCALALALSASVALLAGCGGSKDAPPSEAAAVSTPAICPNAKDAAGREVKFLPSVSDKQLEEAGVSACDIGEDLIAFNRRFSESNVADICSALGSGEQHETLLRMARSATPEDVQTNPQVAMLVKTVAACVDNREKTILDLTFAPIVYSVGVWHGAGKECAAYVYEVTLDSKPNVRGYGVRLLGSCEGQGIDDVLNKKDPSQLAAELVSAGYTGSLPATYVSMKGETLPFAPESTAAPVATPEAAPQPAVATGSPEIPKQFRGVWEETPEACAQAKDFGGATERGVQVMATTLSEYEEGCTIKKLSATGETAIMGVFECVTEGESAESSRSLMLVDGKLMIDRRTEGLSKCDFVPVQREEPVILESDTSEPAPLQAEPVTKSVSVAPTPRPAVSRDEQMVQGYAQELTRNWMSSGNCGQLKQILFQYAGGAAPPNVRVLQMEKLFDKAYDIGCIMQ